jgi:hypothetical protein
MMLPPEMSMSNDYWHGAGVASTIRGMKSAVPG